MRVKESKRKDFWDKVADRIVVLYVAIAVIPVLTLFNSTFRNIIEGFLIGRNNGGFGIIIGFLNFIYYAGFTYYVKNSLIICALSIIISLLIALPAAYALSRHKFKGLNLFGIFIVFPLLIPTISYFLSFAVMVKAFQELTKIQIYNSYNGYIVIAVMYAVMYLPFSIWMLRGFIVSIPPQIEEAARVDGCSTSGVIFRILLPLIRPGIVVTAMLLLMLIWDERLLVDVLMTEDRLRTVALWPSYDFFRYISGPISTIPIFIIYFIFQKNFMKGLTGGALKE
ncbi:MAG: carbohydrate ABC transporter permease [Bacillota bacterium]